MPGDTCTAGDPAPDTCDEVDNDCDGSTDEDLGNACQLGAFTNVEVAGLMFGSCGGCHTNGGSDGGLALGDISASVNVPSRQVPGMDRLEPGDRFASYIYHKIEGTHGIVGGNGSQMPRFAAAWTNENIEQFGLWIDGLAGLLNAGGGGAGPPQPAVSERLRPQPLKALRCALAQALDVSEHPVVDPVNGKVRPT